MQWINRALVQATRKTAPPNGYCRKEECLCFLTMLDLRVVSVEKNELFRVFRNDYSQIRASHYNIIMAGHRFLMKSEHAIFFKFDI